MSDMLDKDRIRLMTKMSIYEKNHKDDFKIADYYRKDYASLKMWITLIWVTIGYAILFVGFCIYSSDSLSADLTILKLFVLLIAAIAGYIVLLYFRLCKYHQSVECSGVDSTILKPQMPPSDFCVSAPRSFPLKAGFS